MNTMSFSFVTSSLHLRKHLSESINLFLKVSSFSDFDLFTNNHKKRTAAAHS